ncbi:hexose transport- protein [Ophiocordyceps sinensis CO18]|uniref:Hexose transport-protein n=1 Tax=Ophiocordyceps sinensis (strain Co18 / CGMCC 3.14243) TaxID=911162 RepID=T5AI20_OPHSC|nr:hexose transport- protein [Ophiocordyceps sinensis CO18]
MAQHLDGDPHGSVSAEKTPRDTVTQVQRDARVFESDSAARLDPWSKTSLQLYMILLVAALNATASGFDGSIFGSINAMSQYQEYFHQRELGSNTGIIFMMFTVGNMVGSLFTGPICDQFGRRIGIMCGSVLIVIGAAVQTAARSDAHLLGGRFVLGFGVSIGTSAAPTYALELAPPQWRARVVGYYNTFFYTGSILATGVAYASSRSPGELAFRLPLSLQIVPPLLIFTGAIWIPESPRWLTMWGKKDQAARILAKYHGGGDPNHPLVQLELGEFESNIELQKASSVWNYWALVDTHNARWRFAMMAFMSVFAQLSGNSVLTYYLPSMYKLLGIIFLFGCAYSFVYTPLTATYCAEVLANPTRAKGMGVHVILSNCANLYNSYVTAIALDALDWRYYLIFVGLNMVYGVVWYLIGVETRGRTLEEMDAVFDAKFPPRAALEKTSLPRRSGGKSGA